MSLMRRWEVPELRPDMPLSSGHRQPFQLNLHWPSFDKASLRVDWDSMVGGRKCFSSDLLIKPAFQWKKAIIIIKSNWRQFIDLLCKICKTRYNLNCLMPLLFYTHFGSHHSDYCGGYFSFLLFSFFPFSLWFESNNFPFRCSSASV